jgi:rhodanese-related sulfurtransferase
MTNSSVTIIDVREENEFNAGHIDQAVLLPRGVLEFKIDLS